MNTDILSSVHTNEFLCPICRRLSNLLLPLIPLEDTTKGVHHEGHVNSEALMTTDEKEEGKREMKYLSNLTKSSSTDDSDCSDDIIFNAWMEV